MSLLVLGRTAVRAMLPMDRAITLMHDAMTATALGKTIQPPRWMMDLPGGDGNVLGLMPSYMADPSSIATKVTAVYPGNYALGRQSHQGVVVLFETSYGTPVAILHGGEITAIRTAAGSALATRLLARQDASRLGIIGYGEQALEHIRAITMVRSISEITIWGRSPDRVRAFADRHSAEIGIEITVAESVEAAICEADIVCTVSAAVTPIVQGRWIAAGTHLNVVGSSSPGFAEVDCEAIARARLYVDLRSAVLANGGDILQAISAGAIDEGHIVGELGEVLTGVLPGRTSDDEITLYKSVGIPVQDLVCAQDIFQRAPVAGLGVVAPF